jgi:hypothetical protein
MWGNKLFSLSVQTTQRSFFKRFFGVEGVWLFTKWLNQRKICCFVLPQKKVSTRGKQNPYQKNPYLVRFNTLETNRIYFWAKQGDRSETRRSERVFVFGLKKEEIRLKKQRCKSGLIREEDSTVTAEFFDSKTYL